MTRNNGLNTIAFSISAAVLLAAPSVTATPAVAAAPDAWRVVSEDRSETSRVLVVRLPARLPEVELRRIAELSAKRGVAAQRTVVRFLLGSAPQQDAWAVATITSEVRVAVTGVSFEEAEAYAAELAADPRTIVGAWLLAPPAAPGRLAVLRDGKGRLFAEWRLRSGLKTIDEVTEARLGRGGRRFDVVGNAGSHFVMTPQGELELRENASLIARAERLAIERPAAVAATQQPAAAQGPSQVVPPSVSTGGEALPSAASVAAGGETAPAAGGPTKAGPRRKSVRPVVRAQTAPQSLQTGDAGPIARIYGQ